MKIKRTERGWPGHFICGADCIFRRNTLLECDERKIVVSTVGNLRRKFGPNRTKMEEIDHERYYETMAFEAQKEGDYWEADVSKEIEFDSPWGIFKGELEGDVDNRADNMHETVVQEISEMMLRKATCPCGSESFTTRLVGDETVTTCEGCGKEVIDESNS